MEPPTNPASGATASLDAAANAATTSSDGQHDNGHADAQSSDFSEHKKGLGQQKKVASWKYIKEEKIAILSVLLDVGMELWEMEKPINKPWRMLFWEQRVALPVREKLKTSTRYAENGFDIDLRFNGAAGVENLRKWVRSQRTQELERVEGERQRLPGSPPGRPLSEVQQLRARAFEEITNATLEKEGDGVAREVVRLITGGDTQAVAAAAAAAAAASAAASGGGIQGVPNGGLVPSLASLFAPSSANGAGVSAPAPAGAAAPATAAESAVSAISAAAAAATEVASGARTSAVAPIHGGVDPGVANGSVADEARESATSPSSAPSRTGGSSPATRENGDARSSSPPLRPQHSQPQQHHHQGQGKPPPPLPSTTAAAVAAAVAAATKKPFLAPRPLGVARTAVDPGALFSASSQSVSGTIDVGGSGGGMGDAYIGAAGTTAAAAGGARMAETEGGAVRRRLPASESTPDDFRLGGGVGGGSGGVGGGYASASAAAAAAAAATAFAPSAAKRQRKSDHTDVVNRVMAQIGSLNLPLEASALLVQSLQAKIAASTPAARWRGGRGGGGGSSHAFMAAAAAAPPGVVGMPGVQGEGEARTGGAGGLSLQERQLLLDERLQASREAEAAQTLAERRLKMMEEMRAVGNNQIVTEEVLQKQRMIVLGL